MSLDPTAFLGEFTFVMAATWPEVNQNRAGIYEIKQAQALSDEQIEDQGGWPYAVFELSPGEPADYGITNAVLRATLTAHWVDQDSVDDSDVRGKLRLLAKAVLAATFTGMTVEEVAGINVHPSHAAEAVFLNKNAAFVAGSVAFTIVYGESAL